MKRLIAFLFPDPLPRLRAARVVALSRVAAAEARRDTRGINRERARLNRITLDLLTHEVRNGRS